MTRALLKTGLAASLQASGTNRLLRRRAARSPRVIYLHRVVPDPGELDEAIPSMFVSCETFEWMLDELARDYRFVGIDDLQDPPATGKPPLALTFDDGYRDFYEHAFPILERKGVPAAVFVVTDLVGTDEAPFHDRLHDAFRRWWRCTAEDLTGLVARAGLDDELELPAGAGFHSSFRRLVTRLPRHRQEDVLDAIVQQVGSGETGSRRSRLMTWEMLAELQDAGITVGSHTRSHVLLPNEEPRRVEEEIHGSRRALERHLGVGPRHFSYPDGSFDAASLRAVAAAGYRAAFTTCSCRDDAYPSLTVPRRHLWEAEVRDVLGRRSGALLGSRVAGAFDLFTRCRGRHEAPRTSASLQQVTETG